MIEYRMAQLSDAEQVAALHAQSWRRTYRGNFPDAFLDGDVFENRRGVWRERLTTPTPNQLVCVAVEDTDIRGFVCAYGAHHAEYGSLIDNLHVTSDHKRQGIGGALMRQAGSWLMSAYADARVYLWVWELNATARRFYEGLGARNAGVFEVANSVGGTSRNCRYFWERPDRLGV
jgi:ribosomal protein S18 acetylase RimI-like enzyme